MVREDGSLSATAYLVSQQELVDDGGWMRSGESSKRLFSGYTTSRG